MTKNATKMHWFHNSSDSDHVLYTDSRWRNAKDHSVIDYLMALNEVLDAALSTIPCVLYDSIWEHIGMFQRSLHKRDQKRNIYRLGYANIQNSLFLLLIDIQILHKWDFFQSNQDKLLFLYILKIFNNVSSPCIHKLFFQTSRSLGNHLFACFSGLRRNTRKYNARDPTV